MALRLVRRVLFKTANRSCSSSQNNSLSLKTYLPGISLLSSIISNKLGQPFEDTLSQFQERSDLVELWTQDLKEEGMSVIYSDQKISIIDCETGSEANRSCSRGLYFNDNLNLVQTEIPINTTTKEIDFTIPLELSSNKNILGFSFGLLFHFLNLGTGERAHSLNSCAVLGAGGCSFPILLALLYPNCQIDAIESDSSVIQAAKNYFGVNQLKLTQQIQIHESCALEWIKKRSDKHCYDMIFLDIYENLQSVPGRIEDLTDEYDHSPHHGRDCVAPSEISLTDENISHYLDNLSNKGVLAINVLGNDIGTAFALNRVDEAAYQYLYSHPLDQTKTNSCSRLAVGVMNMIMKEKEKPKISNLLEDDIENSEDRKHGEDNELPIYNSVIFVIKDYDAWFEQFLQKDSTPEEINRVANLFVKSFQNSRSGNFVPLPFDRSADEYPIVSSWIQTCKFIALKR